MMDVNQQHILFFAFRYALGRKTMASMIVADELVNKWDELTESTQKLIKREILQHHDLGMDCSKQQWDRVLALC